MAEPSSPAKTADFLVRSITTAALAVGLVAALIFCVLTGRETGELLPGFVGLVVGFYFSGNAMTNGSMLRSRAVRSGDTPAAPS